MAGIKPKNEKGENFRNNCWWWRPLWLVVCCVSELSGDTQVAGGFNDGHEVKGEEHSKVVGALGRVLAKNPEKSFESLVEFGELQLLLKSYEEKGYPFDWGNVREFYEFAKNNEGFAIC